MSTTQVRLDVLGGEVQLAEHQWPSSSGVDGFMGATQTRADGSTQSAVLLSLVNNPHALQRVRGLLGGALRSRCDIAIFSNSIGAGQGSSGVNQFHPAGTYPWAQSDNYNGWVGQLRDLLNKPLGIDPGEGFVFAQDPRCTLGSGASAYEFAAPLHQAVELSSGGTLTLAVTASGAGVPNCAYVGVVFWDQASSSLPTVKVGGTSQTMKTTPGGSTSLTATGSGNFVVGYVPASNAASVVVTGGSGATFVSGFDLVGATNGFHVHRIAIPGDITNDLLGGSISGTPDGTTGAGNQIDRTIRSSYQWMKPGVLILAHWDANDFSAQHNTRTLTVQFTSTTAFTVVSGGTLDYLDVAQALAVSGTGVGANAIVNSVSDSTHGTIGGATYTGTLNTNVAITLTQAPSISGMVPTVSASSMQTFLENTGGTANTGALQTGWGALILSAPRVNADGMPPAPPHLQSEYIAAQQALCKPADSLLQYVAGLDMSDIWGSSPNAHSLGLQLPDSTHPTLAGHGDIARIVHELFQELLGVGATTTAVPA